ncbi:MAG: hypothetical protein P8H39_04155 [Thalassotalea sp.]|nr:hypothetical protein [Thalassotalea sp.]
MISNRFITDLKKQNWVAVISDFLVVVIGILVAMQLSSWEHARNEKQLANEYVALLIDDLKFDQQSAEQTISYYSTVQEFGNHALTLWDDKPALSPEKMVIAFYQASNILANNSAVGSYNALAATGRLGLIGGPALAAKLSGYYAQDLDAIIYHNTQYRMVIRGILPVNVQLSIRDNCNEFVEGEILNELLGAHCNTGLSQNELNTLLSDLKNRVNLDYYLRQKISQDELAVRILRLRTNGALSLQKTLKNFL